MTINRTFLLAALLATAVGGVAEARLCCPTNQNWCATCPPVNKPKPKLALNATTATDVQGSFNVSTDGRDAAPLVETVVLANGERVAIF